MITVTTTWAELDCVSLCTVRVYVVVTVGVAVGLAIPVLERAVAGLQLYVRVGSAVPPNTVLLPKQIVLSAPGRAVIGLGPLPVLIFILST